MISDYYNRKLSRITTRNPQANSIVERMHQTIGNMICTFEYDELDNTNPWDGILGAVAFAVRATVHTTRKASPSQLVFSRDAILPIQHVANWQYIKERKIFQIRKDNVRENSTRIPYKYKTGDLVLIKQEFHRKCGSPSYLGPYTVTEVCENGTLQINNGVVTDTYNIRNVQPYRT